MAWHGWSFTQTNFWYECFNISILVSIFVEFQFQDTHYNTLLWEGATFLESFQTYLLLGRCLIPCCLLTMITYYILTIFFGVSWAWVLGFRDSHNLIPKSLKRYTLGWFCHDISNHVCLLDNIIGRVYPFQSDLSQNIILCLCALCTYWLKPCHYFPKE